MTFNAIFIGWNAAFFIERSIDGTHPIFIMLHLGCGALHVFFWRAWQERRSA